MMAFRVGSWTAWRSLICSLLVVVSSVATRFDVCLQSPTSAPATSMTMPAWSSPSDFIIPLRGGNGSPKTTRKTHAFPSPRVVRDMRSPEEKALAAAAQVEELRARQAAEEKLRPPESQRTQHHKAEVRRELEKFAEAHPETNISVEEAMGQWRELFGDDTPEKQLVDAAFEDDVEEIRRLLQEHPDAINRTYANFSALMTAAYEGHLASVCVLVELRSGEDWTALHFAVASGRPVVVEVLLRAGAEVNVHDAYRDDVRKLEDMGATPLHIARRWMRRAGAEWHPRYDPRGGDSYWRIEQMLMAFGAKPWLPRVGSNPGQSIRPALEDVNVERDLLGVPLTDAEKDWLDPTYFHPERVQFRDMLEQGVDPSNTSYFEALEREHKDADRSSSETSTASDGDGESEEQGAEEEEDDDDEGAEEMEEEQDPRAAVPGVWEPRQAAAPRKRMRSGGGKRGPGQPPRTREDRGPPPLR